MTGLSDHALVLLIAIGLDACLGDPRWLYRRVPHPVTLFGAAVDWLDRVANRESLGDSGRRIAGAAALAGLLSLSGGIGWLIQAGLAEVPKVWMLEAVIVFPFLAQTSLHQHVGAVASALSGSGLEAGRQAVGRIVGRDPESLDETGVCRAAIESLAENYADAVLAPIVWYLLFGLPGLLAYKALNTADSMIGHRTRRHRAFGWAAARLDDAANYLPARLAALVLSVAAIPMSFGSAIRAVRTSFRDGGRHRSVNAGWPEAAMAGALGLRLAGPRRYGSETVDDAWMGDGRAAARVTDITDALSLYRRACLATALAVAGIALIA